MNAVLIAIFLLMVIWLIELWAKIRHGERTGAHMLDELYQQEIDRVTQLVSRYSRLDPETMATQILHMKKSLKKAESARKLRDGLVMIEAYGELTDYA